MVTLPAATPVTMPEVRPTVASDADELIQVPPVALSLRAIVCPTHTDDGPCMGAPARTVTDLVYIQPMFDMNVMAVVPLPAPYTTAVPPVYVSVATAGSPLNHELAVAVALVSVSVCPWQIVLKPPGEVASNGLTVTTWLRMQPFTEYMIVTLPAARPNTRPVGDTVARDAEELLHVPPATVSVSIIDWPTHTDVGPCIAAAAFTVIDFVVMQPMFDMKVIVVVPAVSPVTTADEPLPVIETFSPPANHELAPGVAFVTVTLDPWHNVSGTAGNIGDSGFTTMLISV